MIMYQFAIYSALRELQSISAALLMYVTQENTVDLYSPLTLATTVGGKI
jgi:hypothetical protein